MTRPERWDVRIAPDVLEALERRHDLRDQVSFFDAIDRLSRQGTRAPGTKKLASMDLWEVRFRDSRAFFCLVLGAPVIAVGAVLIKKKRRLRMSSLQAAERAVHRWRKRLEDA